MKKIALILCVVFFIASCEKDVDSLPVEEILEDLICEGCGIEIVKDLSRITQYNQTVNISSRGSNKKTLAASKVNSISLKLKGTVDPLYIDYNGGQVLLNANHVDVNSKRVAASYSLHGEPYSGAVDILSVKKGEIVNLEGTLILPGRDIDAVSFLNSNNIFLGGGFDAREYFGGDYPSFIARYKIQYNKKTDVLSLREDELFHSLFGNKLRSLKTQNGIVSGSGGGNSGVIFAFDEKKNKLILNNSNETEGLFILDTSIEKNGNNYDFIALAFNNDTKELKAFYYDISKSTDKMNFSYEVSLGTFNVNVEAKHSIAVPKKGWLAVSLGKEGLGLFKINTDDGVKTASLEQQIKSEILNPALPNEVVNSFVFKSDICWIAAGEAGLYIIPYSTKNNKFDDSYRHVSFGNQISVNSVGKSDNDLVVATTEGVSIFSISGL